MRGVVALAESLRIGARALRWSADAAGEEPVPPGRWAVAVAGGLALAVGLLFVVPVALASLLDIGSPVPFWLGEAVRFAGRQPALIWPGLQLQRLTTREPDDAQLEVALAALDSVPR